MLGALGDVGPSPAGALLIGCDSPALPTEFLDRAVRLAGDPATDLVLGPSEDGGYYLIGARSPRPELFADIPWSTGQVLEATERRARGLGLRIGWLPPWFDVDTAGDLDRLQAALAGAPAAAAPQTRRALARLAGRHGAAAVPGSIAP
jgi:glycosyltransferase A (GT-A) superfamily protein (DUF2064 family)